MMRRTLFYCCLALLASAAWSTLGQAAAVLVPNGDFDNWQAIGDGGVTNSGWASVPGGFTPATNVGRNDEMWTNPASYGSGWQENNKQRTDGKYGLQQPSNAHHVKVGDAEPFSLAAPFSGQFIGFANLTDGDGEGESLSQIQSGVLGTLQPGVYTLTVAFGNRRNTNWNDYSGTISLVADPVDDGGLGTSGGTILGTPASVTMVPDPVPGDAGTDQTLVDLVYALSVGAGDPNIGAPFAVRIQTENLGTLMGEATSLSAFTQANFDNVRLEHVPEPNCLALAFVSLVGLALGARRRGRG